MALIKCPECSGQVSTAAAACPKCGAPIGSPGIQTPLATIQRTSKQLKAQWALFLVATCIGAVVLIGVATMGETYSDSTRVFRSVGWILTLVGVVGSVTTRIRIWWHHE